MKRSSIIRKLAETSRPSLQAILFGCLVAILLVISDQLSIHLGLREAQRIVDDILGGIIAGLIVLGYARLRMQFVAERLNTIALMNHHVRNALQVIRDARYVQPENQKLAEIVEDAVTRIDWALREILPGRITTHDEEGWKQRS